MNAPLKLSILIATLGRVDSLRQVLAGLASTTVSERFEVVVIDNSAKPPLTAAALETPGLRSLRILHELQPGKPRALNRAIDEGGLGEIIAVIDDDMSPAPDWIESVLSATRRLPQFDIFSGKSYVIWPAGVAKPPWADEPLALGLLFSVYDTGSTEDVEFGKGGARFASGNCYWFRHSVLDRGARYPLVWRAYDARFMLELVSQGHRGVFVPEVRTGHRIQKELVDPRKFEERARQIGRALAEFDAGKVPRNRNLAGRFRSRLRPLRALAQLGAWSVAWLLAGMRSERTRLPARAIALWRIAYYRESLNPSQAKARDDAASNAQDDASKTRRAAQ